MKVTKVALVNILEDDLEVLNFEGGALKLEFGAFEIKTLKISLE